MVRAFALHHAHRRTGRPAGRRQPDRDARGPDGNDLPNRGVYLEVVKNERLVVTDAYTKAWEPSEKPFMTLIVTFKNEGGKTKYIARVLHWTAADRETHEKMGFHQGWSQCADQLAALVTKT
jgi:uncharacterized protein YndB with AHSA1/START domain